MTQTERKRAAFIVFSETSGIIITIILTAAFILAGEKYLSSKRSVSWGIL